MRNLFTSVFFLCVMLLNAQAIRETDFIHADVQIQIDPEKELITGDVTYTMRAGSPADSVNLDATNITFKSVLVNGKKTAFTATNNQLSVKNKFRAGREYKIRIQYQTVPRQTVYFTGFDDTLGGNEQVWTQGQGKYTRHWLPSFDDMSEKVEFDIRLTAPLQYTAVANGKHVSSKVRDSFAIHQFDMQGPMSSYLLAFALGHYKKETLESASGIPIELYYQSPDSLRVEPTYRYSREIFDFLESEIGIAYPWQVYRMVPVRDFLYAGMENTTLTIFSDSYVIDSLAFEDRNFVNVNAHELAHQWFGNLVTETDGSSHWLHEGFATYYALRAEKELFGDDYYYWKLYESAKSLDRMSQAGGGESLTDAGAGSLTFYEKGAWALVVLEELLGKEVFKEGIRKFLKDYEFRNASVRDFVQNMERVSGRALDDFFETWLDSPELDWEGIRVLLMDKNPSLNAWFRLQADLRGQPGNELELIARAWEAQTSSFFRKEVVADYHKLFTDDFKRRVLADQSLKVRQQLLAHTNRIPEELRSEYEKLLSDKSYISIELALYHLWANFPDGRQQYLDATAEVIGLPSYNVRMLWLTLALLTPGYEVERKSEFYNELSGFTAARYPYEIRTNAFNYLRQAQVLHDRNLRDLVQAAQHPVWQFRKFSRDLISELLQDPDFRQRFRDIAQGLEGKELTYLMEKLEKL